MMSDNGTGSPDSPSSQHSIPLNRRKREGSVSEEELPPPKRNSYHAVSVKCLVPHQVSVPQIFEIFDIFKEFQLSSSL